MKILSAVAGILIDDAMSRRIININKLLLSLGHQVHIVQYVRKSIWQEQKGNSVDLSAFDHSIVFSSRLFTNLRHLGKLSMNNYDLMFGNHYGGTFWSLLGKIWKLPLIYDMHGLIAEECRLTVGSDFNPQATVNSLVKAGIEQLDIRCSDSILCVSKKMMTYLNSQKKIPSKKTHYVTNGVDLDFFRQVAEEDIQALKRLLGIESKFVFGYIGELQKWQGVENLIDVAKRVNNEKTVFVIIGGKSGQIQKTNNFLLIPRVNYQQVPLYSSICDVLVLPRPNHPATDAAAPTKFAEYTAMNKPILSTNVGDAANLIAQYKCGLVVKNNAPTTLLAGIQQFMKTSTSVLREMGNNSRKLAEAEFDWKKIKLNLSNAIES